MTLPKRISVEVAWVIALSSKAAPTLASISLAHVATWAPVVVPVRPICAMAPSTEATADSSSARLDSPDLTATPRPTAATAPIFARLAAEVGQPAARRRCQPCPVP